MPKNKNNFNVHNDTIYITREGQESDSSDKIKFKYIYSLGEIN